MDVRKRSLYRDKVATVKARGIDGEQPDFVYTEHKRAVREKGFEVPSDVVLLARDSFNLRADGTVEPSDDSVDGSDGKPRRNSFDEELGRFESSVVRARSKVIELGLNNSWDWFVTFTLSAKLMWDNYGVLRYDLDGCNKALRRAFKYYRKHFAPDFVYLVIPEFHADGAVHYHGFLRGVPDGAIITNANGYGTFEHFSQRFGFTNIDRIRDRKKTAMYVTKYTTKGMFAGFKGEGKIDFNKHMYFCSKNLRRDRLVAKGEPVYTKEDFEESGHNPDVDNEFCYKITFSDKAESWASKLVRSFAARSLGFDLPFLAKEQPRLTQGLAVYQADKRRIETRRKAAVSRVNAYDKRLKHNAETEVYNASVKAFRDGRADDKDLSRLGILTNAERLKTDVALRRMIAAGVIDFPDGGEGEPHEWRRSAVG